MSKKKKKTTRRLNRAIKQLATATRIYDATMAARRRRDAMTIVAKAVARSQDDAFQRALQRWGMRP